MKKIIAFILIVLFPSAFLFAQDDLLKMLQDESKPKREPVLAMFKTNKLINIHTNETVRKRNLDVRISHLFGNMGKESGGGVHNLYGIDQSADIRIGFHYGITDHLMVGVARAKRNEDLEGLVKYRILDQTTDNAIPVSVSAFANIAYSVKESADFKNDNYRFVLPENFHHGFLLFSFQLSLTGILSVPMMRIIHGVFPEVSVLNSLQAHLSYLIIQKLSEERILSSLVSM